MAFAYWVKPLQAPFLVSSDRAAKNQHRKATLTFNVEAYLDSSTADISLELVKHIKKNLPDLDAGCNVLVAGAVHVKDPGVGQIMLTSYPGRAPIYKLGSRAPYTYPRCQIQGIVGEEGEGYEQVAERVQAIWNLMAKSWSVVLGEAV